MENINAKMKFAIEEKLRSEDWNQAISTRVLKKRLKRKIIFSTSISSIGMAALVLTIFLFNFQKTSNLYEQFITEQIKGTHNSAGLQFDDSNEIDFMIEEILSQR